MFSLAYSIFILGVTAISEHPLIIPLLEGIFHVRPSQPRYELIWDTDLVLGSYLKNLSSSKYSLKFLSLKIFTLLTLLSGLLKHSRHTKRDNPIPFHASLMMLTCAQLPLLPLLISISLHEQHWQTMSYMMHFPSVIENHVQQKIPSLGGYVPF